jgi:protein-L-isoaspartate(D-aspartate) O-methyltransferase
MADASALHRALIDGLIRRKVIKDSLVEAAFRAVPRHLFLPDVPLAEAYRNEAIPTKGGRRFEKRWTWLVLDWPGQAW